MTRHLSLLHRSDPPASVLDGAGPLSALPPRLRRQLAPHTDVLHPAPGTVLARQGATAREVVVVVAGAVALHRDGRRCGRIGPGDALGREEVVAGTSHPVTAVAGDGVELRVVNGPAFRAAVAEAPGLLAPLALPCAG